MKIPLFSEVVDEEMKIQSSLFYFCEYVRRDEEIPRPLIFGRHVGKLETYVD